MIHDVTFELAPETPQQQTWSPAHRRYFGTWVATCTCGWTARGSKHDIELRASTHDLDEEEHNGEISL
jgi:hypothetical protein